MMRCEMPVSSCVTTMTVVPCSCRRGEQVRQPARRARASTPAVGSSMTSRSAPVARARAMSTRRCCPPDSVSSRSWRFDQQAHVGRGRCVAAARCGAGERPPPPPRGDQPAQHGLPHRDRDAGRAGQALRDEGDPLPGRGSATAAAPNRRTRPWLTACRPSMARTSVVLPLPLGPRRATNSPGPMLRSTSSSTCSPSNSTHRRETPTTSSVADVARRAGGRGS